MCCIRLSEAVFGSEIGDDGIGMAMTHLVLGLQHCNHLRMLGTLHFLQQGFPVRYRLAVLLLN